MNSRISLITAGLVSVLAGCLLATQSLVNGQLSSLVGVGVFAATMSFCIGLMTISIVALVFPPARAGVLRMTHLFTSGQVPLWLCLGGVVGAMIVVAQSVTVPIIGVTVFTTAFIAGQLVGALWIDTTNLPPGGRKPITVWRIAGVIVVVAAVVFSSLSSIHGGFGWAWPLFPFAIGCATGFQQAANGRVKVASRSTIASTFMNFAMGSLFLGIVSVVLTAAGAEWRAMPQLPAQSWLLLGGVFGVMVIGFSAWAVEHLGVLILNLLVLIGNMSASIAIDIAAGHAAAALSPMSLIGVGLVVLGTLLAMIRPKRQSSSAAIAAGTGSVSDATAMPATARADEQSAVSAAEAPARSSAARSRVRANLSGPGTGQMLRGRLQSHRVGRH